MDAPAPLPAGLPVAPAASGLSGSVTMILVVLGLVAAAVFLTKPAKKVEVT